MNKSYDANAMYNLLYGNTPTATNNLNTSLDSALSNLQNRVPQEQTQEQVKPTVPEVTPIFDESTTSFTDMIGNAITTGITNTLRDTANWSKLGNFVKDMVSSPYGAYSVESAMHQQMLPKEGLDKAQAAMKEYNKSGTRIAKGMEFANTEHNVKEVLEALHADNKGEATDEHLAILDSLDGKGKSGREYAELLDTFAGASQDIVSQESRRLLEKFLGLEDKSLTNSSITDIFDISVDKLSDRSWRDELKHNTSIQAGRAKMANAQVVLDDPDASIMDSIIAAKEIVEGKLQQGWGTIEEIWDNPLLAGNMFGEVLNSQMAARNPYLMLNQILGTLGGSQAEYDKNILEDVIANNGFSDDPAYYQRAKLMQAAFTGIEHFSDATIGKLGNQKATSLLGVSAYKEGAGVIANTGKILKESLTKSTVGQTALAGLTEGTTELLQDLASYKMIDRDLTLKKAEELADSYLYGLASGGSARGAAVPAAATEAVLKFGTTVGIGASKLALKGLSKIDVNNVSDALLATGKAVGKVATVLGKTGIKATNAIFDAAVAVDKGIYKPSELVKTVASKTGEVVTKASDKIKKTKDTVKAKVEKATSDIPVAPTTPTPTPTTATPDTPSTPTVDPKIQIQQQAQTTFNSFRQNPTQFSNEQLRQLAEEDNGLTTAQNKELLAYVAMTESLANPLAEGIKQSAREKLTGATEGRTVGLLSIQEHSNNVLEGIKGNNQQAAQNSIDAFAKWVLYRTEKLEAYKRYQNGTATQQDYELGYLLDNYNAPIDYSKAPKALGRVMTQMATENALMRDILVSMGSMVAAAFDTEGKPTGSFIPNPTNIKPKKEEKKSTPSNVIKVGNSTITIKKKQGKEITVDLDIKDNTSQADLIKEVQAKYPDSIIKLGKVTKDTKPTVQPKTKLAIGDTVTLTIKGKEIKAHKRKETDKTDYFELDKDNDPSISKNAIFAGLAKHTGRGIKEYKDDTKPTVPKQDQSKPYISARKGYKLWVMPKWEYSTKGLSETVKNNLYKMSRTVSDILKTTPEKLYGEKFGKIIAYKQHLEIMSSDKVILISNTLEPRTGSEFATKTGDRYTLDLPDEKLRWAYLVGRELEKPIYVYNQTEGKWYAHEHYKKITKEGKEFKRFSSRWVETKAPILTEMTYRANSPLNANGKAEVNRLREEAGFTKPSDKPFEYKDADKDITIIPSELVRIALEDWHIQVEINRKEGKKFTRPNIQYVLGKYATKPITPKAEKLFNNLIDDILFEALGDSNVDKLSEQLAEELGIRSITKEKPITKEVPKSIIEATAKFKKAKISHEDMQGITDYGKAIDYLKANLTNEMLREVLNKIEPYLDRSLKITYDPDDTGPSVWYSASNTSKEFIHLTRVGMYHHTIVHELFHAATAMRTYDPAPGTAHILSRLDAIREELANINLADYDLTKAEIQSINHALVNTAELIGVAFTYSSFATGISKLPYKNTKSNYFTEFVKAIKALFGIVEKDDNLMLEDIFKLTTELLDASLSVIPTPEPKPTQTIKPSTDSKDKDKEEVTKLDRDTLTSFISGLGKKTSSFTFPTWEETLTEKFGEDNISDFIGYAYGKIKPKEGKKTTINRMHTLANEFYYQLRKEKEKDNEEEEVVSFSEEIQKHLHLENTQYADVTFQEVKGGAVPSKAIPMQEMLDILKIDKPSTPDMEIALKSLALGELFNYSQIDVPDLAYVGITSIIRYKLNNEATKPTGKSILGGYVKTEENPYLVQLVDKLIEEIALPNFDPIKVEDLLLAVYAEYDEPTYGKPAPKVFTPFKSEDIKAEDLEKLTNIGEVVSLLENVLQEPEAILILNTIKPYLDLTVPFVYEYWYTNATTDSSGSITYDRLPDKTLHNIKMQLKPSGLDSEIILHELIHIATIRTLLESSTPEQLKAKKAIYDITKSFVDTLDLKNLTLEEKAYVRELKQANKYLDSAESVTYVLTNTTIQNLMYNTTFKGTKSNYFSKFVEALKDLLGLTTDRTYLEEFLRATSQVIESSQRLNETDEKSKVETDLLGDPVDLNKGKLSEEVEEEIEVEIDPSQLDLFSGQGESSDGFDGSDNSLEPSFTTPVTKPKEKKYSYMGNLLANLRETTSKIEANSGNLVKKYFTKGNSYVLLDSAENVITKYRDNIEGLKEFDEKFNDKTAKAWKVYVDIYDNLDSFLEEHYLQLDDFYWNDFTQYLLDENGKLPENIKAAMALGVYDYLIGSAADSQYKTIDEMKSLLGIPYTDQLKKSDYKKYRQRGDSTSAIKNSIGSTILQSLNIKVDKSIAPVNFKGRLQDALGLYAYSYLQHNNYIVTTPEIITFTHTPPSKSMDEADPVTKSFSWTKANMDVVDKIIDKLGPKDNNDKYFHARLFSTAHDRGMPTFKPVEAPVRYKGTSQLIPKLIRKAVTKHNKKQRKLIPNNIKAISRISDNALLKMLGHTANLANVVAGNRDAVTSINLGIENSIKNAKEWIATLSSMEDGLDTPFYLSSAPWKNIRAGVKNKFNIQSDKFHRFLANGEEFETTIDLTNPELVERFKRTVAAGFDIEGGKEIEEDIAILFDKLTKDPIFIKGIQEVSNLINDREFDEKAVEAIVTLGKMNMHTLAAAINYAKYLEAVENKDTTFTYDIVREGDGIANGVAFGYLQYASELTPETVEMLERFGLHMDDTLGYASAGKLKGLEDAYKYFAKLQDIEIKLTLMGERLLYIDSPWDSKYTSNGRFIKGKGNGSRLDILDNITRVIGKPIDDLGAVTSAGRNAAKPILMTFLYGAGITGLVAKLADNYLDAIYTSIQKLLDEPNKAKHGKILDDHIRDKLDAFFEITETRPFEYNYKNLLEFMPTDKQYSLLTRKMIAVYRTPLTNALKANFGNIIDGSSLLQDSVAGVFTVFKQVYEIEINKLRKANTVNGKVNTLFDITYEEREILLNKLKPFMPIIGTAISDDVLANGLVMLKTTKEVVDTEKDNMLAASANAYNTSIKLKSEINNDGKATGKTVTKQGTVDTFQDPGKMAAPVTIHGTDATITFYQMLSNIDVFNIFDAFMAGDSNYAEMLVNANKTFFIQNSKYSIPTEIINMLERVQKALVAEGMRNDTIEYLLTEAIEKAEYFNNNRKYILSRLQSVGQYFDGRDSLYHPKGKVVPKTIEEIVNTPVQKGKASKSKSKVVKQKRFNRNKVFLDTNRVYLFGDNFADAISGYIPKSTQAVIRGLPNAIGISTKHNRGTAKSSYLTDDDYDMFVKHVDSQIEAALATGKTIVIPTDGIGTGKAKLADKAPRLAEYLNKKLDELFNSSKPSTSIIEQQTESSDPTTSTPSTANKPKDISQDTLHVPLNEFINHSGGAKGADSIWGDVGEQYGVKSNHYYKQSADNKKPEKGNTLIDEASVKEAEVEYKKVIKQWGYSESKSDYVKGLLLRNWVQVKNADKVFGIIKGFETSNKKIKVKGGTGYAVQYAINNNVPVAVFDQSDNTWKEWDGTKWVNTETPILTPNFAGIGTRDITQEGRNAIKAVYSKTQESRLTPSSSTDNKTEDTQELPYTDVDEPSVPKNLDMPKSETDLYDNLIYVAKDHIPDPYGNKNIPNEQAIATLVMYIAKAKEEYPDESIDFVLESGWEKKEVYSLMSDELIEIIVGYTDSLDRKEFSKIKLDTSVAQELLNKTTITQEGESATTQYSNQAAQGIDTLYQYEKAIQVNTENTLDLFNQIVKEDNLDPNITHNKDHLESLSNVLINIVNKVMQPVKLHLSRQNLNEALGQITGDDVYLVTGGVPNVHTDNRMSSAEVFVHELVHRITGYGINNVLVRKELIRLWKLAKNQIKPTDLMSNPRMSPKDPRYADELDIATQRWKHIFEPTLNNTGTSNHLEEFMAFGLTNQQFKTALHKLNTKTKSLATDGFFTKMRKLMDRILRNISRRILGTNNLSADKALEALVMEVAGIENKHRNSIIKSLTSVLSWVGNKVDIGNTKIKSITNKITESETAKDMLKAVDSGYTSLTMSKNKFANAAASLLQEAKGRTENNGILHDLKRMVSNNIEHESATIENAMISALNEAFEKPLDDTEKRTLTLLFLDSDFSTVFKKYGKEKAVMLLADPSKAGLALQALQSVMTPEQLLQANNLVNFISTHESALANAKLNATQIAGKDASPVLIEQIDTYISLASFRMLSIQDPELFKGFYDLIKNKDPKFNGISFLLETVSELKEQALQENFGNNPINMIKGYMPEIYGDVDMRIGTLADEEKFASFGFTEKVEIPSDSRMKGETQYMYFGPSGQPMVQGIVSFDRNTSKGFGNFESTQRKSLKTKGDKIDSQILKSGAILNKLPARLVPIYNGKGHITGYRYVMTKATKRLYMQSEVMFDKLVARYSSEIYTKKQHSINNRKIVDALHSLYIKDKNEDLLNKHVLLEEVADYKDIWLALPEDMQKYARKKFGGHFISVRKEHLNLLFGYGKYSLVDMFTKDPDMRNVFEKVIVNVSETLLGKNAARKIAFAENGLQAFISLAKDILVIRSGFLTIFNTMSNLMVLGILGVNPIQAMEDLVTIPSEISKFEKASEDLKKLNMLLKRSPDNEKLKSKIAELQNEITTNPIAALVNEGVLTNVFDDLGNVSGSLRTGLPKLLNWGLGKVDAKPIKEDGYIQKGINIMSVLTIDRGTKAHSVMTDAARYSDFIARYSYVKSQQAKGVSLQDAIADAMDIFVNYDLPSNKYVQYMNDIGLLMFHKYLVRIQKIILRLFKDKPLSTMLSIVGSNMLDTSNGIIDSAIGVTNPLDRLSTPADYLDMYSTDPLAQVIQAVT